MNYLTDPLLRAPMIGSILMCYASALIGVLVLVRRRSLLGEALSHAAYPGVVIAFIFSGAFAIGGAAAAAFAGLWLIDRMERKWRVKDDSALCFVLSLFFGIGVLIASRVQIVSPLAYREIQVFLYGQAATMSDIHVLTYALLAIGVTLTLFFSYRQMGALAFDRSFAHGAAMKVKRLDFLLYLFIILAIVIGIRSVGVVLMAGMLIAPAVAARQLSSRLDLIFIIAAAVGAISGFLGNYLSIEIPPHLTGEPISLATGPMILLTASSFAFLALFARFISRVFRIVRFRHRTHLENIMKVLWKQENGISFKAIQKLTFHRSVRLQFLLTCLRWQGWMERKRGGYSLTPDGTRRSARIVRVHRLWEAYLVYLGQKVEKVHRNAEEMEHIITPDLEKELAALLEDPKQDPHHQPIPASQEFQP